MDNICFNVLFINAYIRKYEIHSVPRHRTNNDLNNGKMHTETIIINCHLSVIYITFKIRISFRITICSAVRRRKNFILECINIHTYVRNIIFSPTITV